jgi:uncharacterized damage-inducible protein DinB
VSISPFLITDLPGFTPQISRLVSMMNYARETTLQMVRGLSVEELDFLLEPEGNSIGMLLEHFAAVEIGYQGFTFDGNDDWDAMLGERWKAGGELGALGRERIRGHELSYYLENLRVTRERTLDEFKRRDDAWLEEPFPFWGETGNRYFCWFHVFEDEINHRGQIRLIHKALPSTQNRGVLGIGPSAATEDGWGVKLSRVAPDGSAGKAGLLEGDVVLSVNGLDVTGLRFEDLNLGDRGFRRASRRSPRTARVQRRARPPRQFLTPSLSPSTTHPLPRVTSRRILLPV